MGRSRRNQPVRLQEKLLAIRMALNLSQEELVTKLASDEITLYRSDISKFEGGTREPPLLILLRYARVAGVTVDVLIDDSLDLPRS
jgi:transcriptional regulator with XRE-family HTH domain